MGRIKLSKRAKRVLRLLAEDVTECPADMDREEFSLGALELKHKGLVICHEEEGGDVVVAKLSGDGRLYLDGVRVPSRQWNEPTDWKCIVIVAFNLITLTILLVKIAIRLHWI